MRKFVQLYSEIGKLNTVILHRPGTELEQLIPPYLEYMLSEDTPYVRIAAAEHDAFAQLLFNKGTNVLYLSNLFRETIENQIIREAFIEDYLQVSRVASESLKIVIREYLQTKTPAQFVEIIMRGVMKRDLIGIKTNDLPLVVQEDYPFYTDPLCGIYFTRDIGVCIGNGMIVSSMSMPFRQRETLLVRYIWKYHPLFRQDATPLWYDNNLGYSIEGGDVHVLSDKVLAIGYSERTSLGAIEAVAGNVLKSGYEKILLFNLPKSRRYMHLDVLFTMVDYNKFLVTPPMAEGQFEIYEITMDRQGELRTTRCTGSVKETLQYALKLDEVIFIPVGAGDVIHAPREHWNMGSNVLTIAPGEVIAYDRNEVTNEQLDKNGVQVHTFSGAELSRGRGGPRCMSMPINRD